ncbi:MAG: TonB-dependent receptor [Bacteroidota bacterium]|nr:TonB-dependent receptor [Bacteroidota bacterium]
MKIFFTLFLGCIFVVSFAQTSTVKGLVKDEITQKTLDKAVVRLTGTTFTYTTAADGLFAITNVPYGRYTFEVVADGHVTYSQPVDISLPETIIGAIGMPEGQLETIKLETEEKTAVESLPTVSLSETEISDASEESVSSALGSSRDIFISTASYTWSEARFRIRGYNAVNFYTYMNGLPVNDLETGRTNWGAWGGLNTVLYNHESRVGLQATDFSFGGVGGENSFDSRAGLQRKQLEISYANTDRNFTHRLTATYSTGVMKHGWAVSVAASKRWAKEGYVPGTFYDGYSYFFAIQKYFNENQSINLSVAGAPTTSGGSSASTQEMYNLAGSNYYNPDWGWQNGQKRNSVVSKAHEPLFILTHDWKINNKSSLVTAAGFSFSQKSRSGIDWNNASNPKPDYYAYLPSYIKDSTIKAVAQTEFRNNENLRQINWAGLYDANRVANNETIDSVDGVAGKSVTGRRSHYIVDDAVQADKKFDFNTVYNNSITEHISITAGLTYQFASTENYQKVVDLLGGQFYVDVNQFAERDFPGSFLAAQNNTLDPNRILHVGDKYGYDYLEIVHHGAGWLQSVFRYKKIDFFAAAELSGTAFWRNGKYKNGLFQDDSYGKSQVNTFINYAFKGGVTYKLNGRNYLYANGLYETRAPLFGNSFISARTRNDLAPNLKSETVGSAEIGYRLRLPNLRIKADLFFAQFMNSTRTTSFYDDDLRTFVNYTLTGINTRNMGAELGVDWSIYKGFGATTVTSIGKYIYTDRPNAIVSQDNNNASLGANQTVYIKNFDVAGTPQLATTFGLNYHSPQNWFVSVNFNYYDWMSLEFNPVRRTIAGVDLVDQNSQAYKDITDEVKLKGQFTMDVHAGYTWQMNNQFPGMKKKYAMVFNLGITNVTNNKNFVIGGYEQTRFDFTNKNPNTYPPKITYGYGATYFLNVAFRMN